MEQKERIDYIDGIKGIASILVVLCHLSCVFFPGLYFLDKSTNDFELIWINSPLNIITNGNFSICTFFIISGFLIAKKTQNKKTDLSKKIINIYVRMLKIVIPAILFSYILMKFGLMEHLKALSINKQLEFVNTYNNFEPTFFGMIKDIILTFFKGSSYNNPLWTIKYEVFGSMIIYAFSNLINNVEEKRKYIYIIAMVATIPISITIVPFFMGAFLFECININNNTFIDDILKWIIVKKYRLYILFIIGIYFASINMFTSGVWKILSYIPAYDSMNIIFRSGGIAIIVFCIHHLKYLNSFLSEKTLVYLGMISRYIYVFHWPIILSLGCLIFIKLYNINYYLSVLIIVLSVIITTIIISILYDKLEHRFLLAIKNKKR